MNLSVGTLTGLCAMVAAWLMLEAGLPAPLAVLGALGVGLAAGLVNGLLVVFTRINGFIVTLATMTIIEGLRYGINGPDTFQGYSQGLRDLGAASLLGLPVVLVFALVVAALVALFFGRAVAGRKLLATGGSPFAARLSGVSNDRSIVIAHGLSGLLAGVAAVITVAASGSVNSSIGDDLLLPSFAAPIIGGVALAGGVVSVAGTCLAAFLVRLVDVMQAQFGINPRWIDLIVGAVVLGAVLLGTARQRLSRRLS
ncbi:ABC transporter permease [Nonomuraea antimicrobica]